VNWIKKRFVALFFKHAGIALRDAKLPLVNRFGDISNEQSLIEALHTIGKEHDWPVASGTARSRLLELGNHFGEYDDMWRTAITAFFKPFDTEKRKEKR
jgi:hypothetical protein